MKVAIVRGKFLNRYEMQFYEPLVPRFDLTAFGSLTSYHHTFAFPVVSLPSPMDLPNIPYTLPILNRLFVDSHYLLGLERQLRGFDLVHTAETYFHYTQQCLTAKRKGYVKRVIATVLENIPHNNEGIRGRQAFKASARKDLDHIIALTNLTRDALLAEGADAGKITVISHFIDTKMFTPALNQLETLSDVGKTTWTILFSGRIESYKGVFDLVYAAKFLSEDAALKSHSLKYLIVGAGSQLPAMQRLEEKLGIARLFTHSQKSYEQMPQVYQAADIAVLPSKPTPTWEEQYCTALLEAQAAGLPIVTTTSGGIPENIGDAGLLVQPGDPWAVAHALKQYILTPHLRTNFAQRARNRAVGIHDMHIGAKKLADLYVSLF